MSLAETDYMVEDAPERDRGRQLATVERRHHILALRRRGMTYAQISETLASREQLHLAGLDWEPIQVTEDTCSKIVKRYLQKLERDNSETREELRTLENERLDELLRHWGPIARGKSPEAVKAANVVLRIAERRAKLNGLDTQNVNVNVSGSILHELGVDPDEIRRSREAFETSFAGGLPAPADVTLSDDDFEELSDAGPEDS